MKTGIVFDIKEFALFDGPGIRTTVFLKGCPLMCQWCHNPEGLSNKPQLLVNAAACTHCGACGKVCAHTQCIACGECVPYCRAGLRRIAGVKWNSNDLAARLIKNRIIFENSGGGVTFSGGEPLTGWGFVSEVISKLNGIHTAVETSGYAAADIFTHMMNTVDLVLMDIKQMDPDRHKRFTGVDNGIILENGRTLIQGETPFIIRMPVIPGVNDYDCHFEAVAAFLEGAKHLVRVEMLPYHKTAGAKYEMAGMRYAPDFNPDADINISTEPFLRRGMETVVL